MTSKGKRLTNLIVALGVAVLAAAGYAFKDKVVEQWYIWELESEDKAVRKRAANNLGEMKSVRALPQLMKLFRNEASTVSHALVQIGRPAVPFLIRELDDQDGDRTSAAGTLSSIGPEAREAVPALIGTVRRQDDWQWAARDNSVLALAKIAPESEAVVEALMDALNDPNENVRYSAAAWLGNLGAVARKAVPALKETLKDKHGFVRRHASEAIQKIEAERPLHGQ